MSHNFLFFLFQNVWEEKAKLEEMAAKDAEAQKLADEQNAAVITSLMIDQIC